MSNREIHYRYVLSYLLVIIVLIIALAYYDVPDLVDKLSFALTLSSLLLAMLAIFYTIINGHKQDDQFAKIIEASAKLHNSVGDIENASRNIARLTNEVPGYFKEMGSKIDNISLDYRAISDSEQQESQLKPGPEVTPQIQELRGYIANLQFAAMGVLYLFTQASLNSKFIEVEDIVEFPIAEEDYAIGFLNGFETTGLIDFKLHKDSIVPIRCESILYDNLRGELMRVCDVISEDWSKTLLEAIRWADNRYAITNSKR